MDVIFMTIIATITITATVTTTITQTHLMKTMTTSEDGHLGIIIFILHVFLGS